MLIPSCKKLFNIIIYHKTDVGIYLYTIPIYLIHPRAFRTELNEKAYFNEGKFCEPF